LADAPVEITNVPHLHDVITTVKLLGELGAKVTVDQGTLSRGSAIVVNPCTVDQHVAPYELVKTMRASILVLGPLLAKYGRAEVSLPGGCAIGSLPGDQHSKGLQALGAHIAVENGFIKANVDGLLKGVRKCRCQAAAPSARARSTSTSRVCRRWAHTSRWRTASSRRMSMAG